MAKQSLLLVDSDERSRRVLEISLKKAGFNVTTAASGQDALQTVELLEPDLIISDTRMPDMDGFTLCSRLKEHPDWARIPFIFLTSEKSIEDKIRGLELGVEDYLTKPIYIKEIVTRVRILLQKAARDRMERRDSRTKFEGSLADLAVVDLLQTIDISGKSGVIHFEDDSGKRAEVYFREGAVIDAELGPLRGEDAVYRLLTWSDGHFVAEFKPVHREATITVSNQGLLMEGLRRLDEWGRLLEELPPLTAVFEVNYRELRERIGEIPDEVNQVLRLFDGRRTLHEVVDDCVLSDLETLNLISKLYFEGIIYEATEQMPEPSDFSPPAVEGWLRDPLAAAAAFSGAFPAKGVDADEAEPAHSDDGAEGAQRPRRITERGLGQYVKSPEDPDMRARFAGEPTGASGDARPSTSGSEPSEPLAVPAPTSDQASSGAADGTGPTHLGADAAGSGPVVDPSEATASAPASGAASAGGDAGVRPELATYSLAHPGTKSPDLPAATSAEGSPAERNIKPLPTQMPRPRPLPSVGDGELKPILGRLRDLSGPAPAVPQAAAATPTAAAPQTPAPALDSPSAAPTSDGPEPGREAEPEPRAAAPAAGTGEPAPEPMDEPPGSEAAPLSRRELGQAASIGGPGVEAGQQGVAPPEPGAGQKTESPTDEDIPLLADEDAVALDSDHGPAELAATSGEIEVVGEAQTPTEGRPAVRREVVSGSIEKAGSVEQEARSEPAQADSAVVSGSIEKAGSVEQEARSEPAQAGSGLDPTGDASEPAASEPAEAVQGGRDETARVAPLDESDLALPEAPRRRAGALLVVLGLAVAAVVGLLWMLRGGSSDPSGSRAASNATTGTPAAMAAATLDAAPAPGVAPRRAPTDARAPARPTPTASAHEDAGGPAAVGSVDAGASSAPRPVDPRAVAKTLAEAKALLKRGRARQAVDALTALLAKVPGHPEARKLLGQHYYRVARSALDRSDYRAAVQAARRAVAYDDQNAEAWMTLGFVLAQRKEVAPARQALQRYLQLCPKCKWASYVRQQLKTLK